VSVFERVALAESVVERLALDVAVVGSAGGGLT
jgi:hypothetical protein